VATAHYRRNFLALLGDYIGFGLAMTFAGITTTLPAYIAHLTPSKVVVGLFTTASDGAWLLPQIFFANFLLNKRRKKPYILLGSAIGRPWILFYALALALGLGRSPSLALGLLFAAEAVFLGSDALAAVAWFDVLAKAMPEERRGRLIGLGQGLNGLLAIGAGAVIARLLGDQGPPFPLNYAVIFALAGFFLLFSFASLCFVVEPEEPVAEERPSWGSYLAHLRRTLVEDRLFRRVIGVRLLAGFDLLASGFYILFATRELGLPSSTVGLYAAVQTAGTILASVAFGALSERAGSQRVIQVATAIGLIAPLTGLILFLLRVRGGTGLLVVYALVFLVVGAVGSAYMLCYVNYVLRLSPAHDRPTYVGLFNTAGGLLVVLPTLGGAILQSTSYGVLFGLAGAAVAASHILSWHLPKLAPQDHERP
jgi:MFS family permease